MPGMIRVLEIFKVTGVGWSYLVHYEKDHEFRAGEVLYDLSGNRFEIQNIGIPSGEVMDKMKEKRMAHLVLRPLDQKDVQGTVLTMDPETIGSILPDAVDDRCRECIQYKVDHSIDLYDYCYRCHEKTMKWFQYDFGTFGLKCESCGARLLADLNTPCEEYTVEKAEQGIGTPEISAWFMYWDKCRYPHRPSVIKEED